MNELESRSNAAQLHAAYKAIARKVNGFKGKPETRVRKAIAAIQKAPEAEAAEFQSPSAGVSTVGGDAIYRHRKIGEHDG